MDKLLKTKTPYEGLDEDTDQDLDQDPGPSTSENDVEEEDKQARQRWWNLITVEPVMFLYMMAFMLTNVVEQAFFVDKACRVNLNFSDAICSNLTADEYESFQKQVQIVVSNFHQYNNIASHVMPLILAFFLGAWSDRRGRKLPLLLGLLGKATYSTMIVVNALQDTWPLETVIWSASLPSAMTGADVAIFMGAFSYLADITTTENRTWRVTILDITYLVTMPAGIALGKYLWSSVMGRSYAGMFALNATLLCLAILFGLWRLEWRTTERQSPLPRAPTQCCMDFFDIHHVADSVKAIVRKRPGRRRMYLIMIFISMALYTFQRDEKPMTYLYTLLKFHWDAETYSDYRTYQSSSYVIGTLLGIHIMGKLMEMRDTSMVMVGATAHALARLVFAVAEVSWLFYVGGTIVALGPIVAPVLRSMASKVVPASERGKVFAILAVTDNAIPLFSGVLYTQVYNATIDTLPSAIFIVTIASQVLVFLFSLCIHISLGKEDLEDKEEQLAQQNDTHDIPS